jgi:hypothetical protein
MTSSPERTTKKTPVASIVACESVATQRPSFVDCVGPQCARHNIFHNHNSPLKYQLAFMLVHMVRDAFLLFNALMFSLQVVGDGNPDGLEDFYEDFYIPLRHANIKSNLRHDVRVSEGLMTCNVL